MNKSAYENSKEKGNILFSLRYALTSLRRDLIRNAGIALVLAIGISLPSTVFIWTSTGARIALHEYLSTKSYQYAVEPRPNEVRNENEIDDACAHLLRNPLIETVHKPLATIGILSGGSIPNWTSYGPFMSDYWGNAVYYFGIKDTEVFLVNNEMLNAWKGEFSFQGRFNLSEGEILVSENFIIYAQQVHGINIELGTVISIDLVYTFPLGNLQVVADPEALSSRRISNLTVAGIYRHTARQSLLANSYPTYSRRNWNILDPFAEPVFGFYDSVMILQDQVGEESATLAERYGFFQSVLLARASEEGLTEAGLWNAASTLTTVRTQFEEQYPRLLMTGLLQLWRLEDHMNTFIRSQILTVLTFPVLIMALMLSIFTSETSIVRKKSDVRVLRTRGASYNQIMTTLIIESTILAISGFFLGMGLSYMMAPFMGASVGFFNIDQQLYSQFLEFFTISPIAFVIAGAIAMFLPMTYLFHVARKIEITEIGQPTQTEMEPEITEEKLWKYGASLGAILCLLLLMPIVISPVGNLAISEVLISTFILFISAFLGSRVMIMVTSRFIEKSKKVVGEKSLYMTQSLKRRKGQFIPLLVILTLTLTTTTMMIIQASSFNASVQAELDYSIGSDLRIECEEQPLNYNETILQFLGVNNVTPVVEAYGVIGSSKVHILGIDPIKYLYIGHFFENSFISDTPESALKSLEEKNNGIIIPHSLFLLWNKTINDELGLTINLEEHNVFATVMISGTVNSAPGFGAAVPSSVQGSTFSSHFGFNDDPLPFVLVDVDFLHQKSGIDTADVFLVDLESKDNADPIVEFFSSQRRTQVFTLETYDIASESYTIRIYLSGIQGLTAISTLFCAIMGLGSISLFLTSAVYERQPEYAIMRAIGGTRKNIVSIVFAEFAGSVITAICISAILGVVFGYVMSILTVYMSPFIPILPIAPTIPLLSMTVILVTESIVMCASCYIPARKAGSVDPAGILRNL